MTAGAIVIALLVIGFIAINPFAPKADATGLVTPTVITAADVPRDGMSLGSATAKVTLDVWEDFQCPNCARYTETIEPQIISQFVSTGQLKLTFHDYLVVGLPESLDAASAARCANGQGKFWEYHAWLFANQNGENAGWFSAAHLAGIASKITGLDLAKWQACYNSGSEKAAIEGSTAAGSAIGLTGTPTLSISGKILTFTTANDLMPQIQAAIDAANGVAPSPSAPAPSGSVAPISPPTTLPSAPAASPAASATP